jgi:16S rRNA (guanine527-N7)-methyltransferase
MSLLAPTGGWAPLVERAQRAVERALDERDGVVGSGSNERSAAPSFPAVVCRYLDELVVWNRRMDLTAARSPEELVDLAVADAAVIAGASRGEGGWVDVGSGAGAPGLALALWHPAIRMTLVEPRERRVAFLRTVIGKLGLARVTVERMRSDRLPSGAFDTAVSRATLPPVDWLPEGARLSSGAVWVLLARDDPPRVAGLRSDLDLTYAWPLTGATRRAIRYVPV